MKSAKKSKGDFALFKPLFGVALAVICFELLPIDFQHYLAPSLVSYDEVFYASLANPVDYVFTESGELPENVQAVSVNIKSQISLN